MEPSGHERPFFFASPPIDCTDKHLMHPSIEKCIHSNVSEKKTTASPDCYSKLTSPRAPLCSPKCVARQFETYCFRSLLQNIVVSFQRTSNEVPTEAVFDRVVFDRVLFDRVVFELPLVVFHPTIWRSRRECSRLLLW